MTLTAAARPTTIDTTIAEHQPPETAAEEGFAYDVAIVGLGYVGLPTALAYHHAGQRVLGVDVSSRRLDAIRSGAVDLVQGDRDRLVGALGDEGLTFSDDVSSIARAAAVIVCVPTPVDRYLVPDLAMLRAACATVLRHVVRGQVIVLTSTTYVGCTQDLLVEPLTEAGFTVGRDVFVAFSAERIDPGNDRVAQEAVPRVIGAATPECEEEAAALLGRAVDEVHRVPSLAAAEMTKLLENTFRAVNIALANEFADVCQSLDIDVHTVIGAAATKPYGFMAFQPGPGVGGHCIPCDPHYLLWQLRAARIEAPVISEAMTQIAARPGRIVHRIRESLVQQVGTAPRVLLLGVAYKPDVADVRESPALEILQQLRDGGVEVAYVDPHVPLVALPDGTVLEALAEPEAFDPSLIFVHTRHAALDTSWIGADRIVFDATGALAPVVDQHDHAGFERMGARS